MHEQLELGIEARDEAIEKISRSNSTFLANCIQAIGLMPPGEVTGEDLRLRLSAQGLNPKHHNAWGAVIMNAVRLGMLVNTGRTTKMRAKRSHARRTPIYRKALR